MGARGPSPTRTKDLRARGSWRANGRPEDLELEVTPPKPPAKLSRDAAAEWKRIVKLLGPKSVLTEADRIAMTMLCELWAEDRSLGKMLAKMIVGSTDWKRVVTQRNETRKQLSQLCAKFGMTPADRTRVKIPEGKSQQDGKGKFFDKNTKPRLVG